MLLLCNVQTTVSLCQHMQEPAGDEIYERARTLFEERKYNACLLTLNAEAKLVAAPPGMPTQLLQAQALVCTIHLHAEQGAWWKVPAQTL